MLNSLGDATCRPSYVEVLQTYLREKSEVLSPDARDLIDRKPLRVLDSKTDRDALTDSPRMADHLCEPCATHYQKVKDALEGLGVPYVEDGRLVRGLDYYTRTTFEFIGGGLDTSQNAVGGGGRYDGLAETIGGRSVPGVGFALGMDRIILSLGESQSPRIDAYLVSETGSGDGLRVASHLRGDGLRIDFDTEGRSVKAQFRSARRIDAPVVLVWKGDDQPVDIQTETERAERPLQEVSDWFRDNG